MGARGVGRGVELVKLDRLHQAQRVLELLLRFARKADDRVGGDGRVGQALADTLDEAYILSGGVPARHCLEDVVVARLKRDVEHLTQRGRLGNRVDDARRHVPGVRRDEAQPREAGRLSDFAQQVGELLGGREVAPPRVNILAEERHLAIALLHQRLHLGLDSVAGT